MQALPYEKVLYFFGFGLTGFGLLKISFMLS